MTTQDRIKRQASLTAKGYHIEYDKNWQPRVDMWWHKNWLNTDGDVVKPAGTKVPNQPGNPDTQVRLSNRGMRPWPPSDDCSCIWCRRQAAGMFTPGVEEPVEEPVDVGTEEPVAEEPEEDAPVFSPPTETRKHPHKFGKAMGSKCSVSDCTATRQTPFAKRTKRAA